MPLPLRIAFFALGTLAFVASFFFKNSVDGAGAPVDPKTRTAALVQQDALTMSLRAGGAFVMVVALLTWVLAETARHPGGFF